MKVICRECKNFVVDTRKCEIKKMGGGKPATVHPGKRRTCEKFEKGESK